MSNKWGCLGLTVGGAVGLLLAMVILLLLRATPPLPPPLGPATIPPDVTIFLSEQSLSRMASDTLKRPAIIDFDPNGQMQVSTTATLGQLEPLIHVGLQLEMQGTEIESRLRWVRLGFLTIPARWLPQTSREAVVILGQAIKNQTPPDFMLVGLETTPEGINFQLKWVGQ